MESTSNRFSLGSVKEEHESDLKQSESSFNIQTTEIGNLAKFDSLIDMVVTSFAEVQATVQDLLQLKDDLLLHYLPPPLLFKIAIVFGNAYRTFSDLNTPVFEMLRLVKIFSVSWEKNSAILKKLHDMYETKKQLLNIAIKRLALVEKKTKLFAREKRVMNWEKLFIKLSEAKGHGRRWKFQIEAFKKKANEGYEELLHWISKDNEDGEEEEDGEKEDEDVEDLPVPKKRTGKSREKSRALSRELSREKSQEIKGDKFNENRLGLDNNFFFGDEKNRKNENFMMEVDSDQDFFSEGSSSFRASPKRKAKKEPPPKKMEDKKVQTEKLGEEKTTWTGEPIYQRSFIVRIFKPQELNTKKLRFKITLGNRTFTSKVFEYVKPEKRVKIVEAADIKPKAKKPSKKTEENLEVEKKEEKKLDLSRYEDFIFELHDYHNKKDVLETDMENCIKFEVSSEAEKEGAIGFLNVQMDDIHTLDLPILYFKTTEDAQVIDFYETNDKKEEEKPGTWLRLNDLTVESVENYELLSKRTPFMFDVYKTAAAKQSAETVCKLPLMFFWTRKPVIEKHDKNTGSQTIKDIVENLTGLDIEKTTKDEIQMKMKPRKDVKDGACSPIPALEPPPPPPPQAQTASQQQRPFSSISSGIAKKTDLTASKEDMSNEDIQNMHENYQLKIDELNLVIYKLENELAQQKSLNELKSEQIRSIRSRASKTPNVKASIDKTEKTEKTTKPVRSLDKADKSSFNVPQLKSLHSQFRPNSSSWNKDFPEDFFERLKLFNEKSTAHQKEILDKYMMEEASIREQQMAVQHRLDSQTRPAQKFEDFCLPAVFMPFKSGNSVFNPRAHQYFHPTVEKLKGSTDIRLTQPPTIFQLPPLPSKTSVSVINLFDLGRRYESGEPDFYINEYIKKNFNSPNKMLKTTSSDSNLRESHESNIEAEAKNPNNLFLNETNFKANN